MYEGRPHLFTPIITEPRLAATPCQRGSRRLERPVKAAGQPSVRNIEQYNKLFEGTMASLFDDARTRSLCPSSSSSSDELADLMILDRANVEESITRLRRWPARRHSSHPRHPAPQRRCHHRPHQGQHSTRISFRLSTKVDSRTILDNQRSRGSARAVATCSFCPRNSRLLRLHAPYVSEKETPPSSFLEGAGRGRVRQGFLESPKDDASRRRLQRRSRRERPPFQRRRSARLRVRKASTSLLQRRLRIATAAPPTSSTSWSATD